MRILMVGLDAAGKTTILYKLKLGEGRSFVYHTVGLFSNDGQLCRYSHVCELALIYELVY